LGLGGINAAIAWQEATYISGHYSPAQLAHAARVPCLHIRNAVMLLGRILRGAFKPFSPTPQSSLLQCEQLLRHASECLTRGALEEARTACLRAVDSCGDDMRAHHILGVVLAKQGHLEGARLSLENANRLAPRDPDVLVDLGNLWLLYEDASEAAAFFAKALVLVPNHTTAALSCAGAFERLGRADEAAKVLRDALTDDFRASLVRALISLLERNGRVTEARELCARIIAVQPGHAEAHSGAGYIALKHDMDAAVAIEHLERAIIEIKDDSDLWSNLGIAYQEVGQLDRASSSYEEALRIAPNHAATLVHRALLWLLQGDYQAGWREYEQRRLAPDWVVPPFNLPSWAGEDVSHKTILVHSEQGIGDEILFASCFAQLLGQAGSVIIECHAKLLPMFARSFPTASVRSLESREQLTGSSRDSLAELMVAAGSLPSRYRSQSEDFLSRASYLKPDPVLVDVERQKLTRLGPGLKVGLSWRGGTDKTWGTVRSMPLMSLLPVLRVTGIEFVNLQYGSVDDELRELQEHSGIRLHHFPETLHDYDSTAALTAALDLVVSVDTAIVQLAGAMGCRAWAMVTVSPDWRYGRSGDTTPWYPSVRVFRQTRYREWDSVVAGVAAALAAEVAVKQRL